MTDAAPAPAVDIDAAIQKYIELRDACKKIDDDAKAAKKPFTAAMDKLETVFRVLMTNSKLTQLASASGTAFFEKVTRCSVTDWDAAFKDMQARGDYSMLTHGVSKTEVEAYITQHEAAPPGVKFEVLREVQVRRKS